MSLKLAEQEEGRDGDAGAGAEIKATVLVNAAEAYRQLGEYVRSLSMSDVRRAGQTMAEIAMQGS